ncbi:MAG: hypothetical protein RL557_832 [archaeon]|jgi:DNA polymerase II small subunit
MTHNILRLFIEKGFLLDKGILDFLEELDNETVAREILDKIAVVSRKKLITKHLINENIEKIKPLLFELDSEKKKLVDKYFVNVHISVEVKKESTIELASHNSSENSKFPPVTVLSSPSFITKKIEVKDFIKYFRSRYLLLRKILQERGDITNLISIDKIAGNRDFSIIGMVLNKQVTKNKNILLEVEDFTGKATLLINQNKEEVYKKSKEILCDDIIGFKCNGTRDFLFVNDLYYPDCFLTEKKHTNEELYALFISDVHVGSNKFLENNFTAFIDWLRGVNADEKQKEMLEKIRYLFVVGDTVDGVGVYPGQEKELKIKDIRKQYELLADFYKKIPERILIIQCAGQHDAVRVAEPQPPVGIDFAEPLHTLPNVRVVSNPSLIEIESGNCSLNGRRVADGIKVLMYHGASMHSVINEIEELRLSNAHSTPAKVVKHLLLRRHLAPTHGLVTYIPDSYEDPLVIKEIPDIVTTGDLHRTDIDSYNNVLIISNSCWQSITAFEEKVGNNPDPCKVPILNLKTRAIKILDFSDEVVEYG